MRLKMNINENSLYYLCSLIEAIGRKTNQERSVVVDYLGTEGIKRIYSHASVLHCEPLEVVAEKYSEIINIPKGSFDNIKNCEYKIPTCFEIGAIYQRLIMDVCEDKDFLTTLFEVYHSFLSNAIQNFNTSLYYQSREYLAACYKENKILL